MLQGFMGNKPKYGFTYMNLLTVDSAWILIFYSSDLVSSSSLSEEKSFDFLDFVINLGELFDIKI